MNPPLSPEQKRIKEAYSLVYGPTLLFCMLLCVAAFVLISLGLAALGWRMHSSFGAIIPVSMMAAPHIWTVRKLQRQGLSLSFQKTEVLENLATSEEWEMKEWYCPKTWLGSVSNAIFPFLMSGTGWFLCHWPFSPASWFERGLGIFTFGLFGWWGIVGLIFIRSSHVRVDSKGITAFPSPFRRHRVRWADIARCEIRLVYDYMGNEPSRFFYFKSAQGKTLLRLIPGSLSGLSRDEQAEIEQEIKRRLGHATESDAALQLV